MIDPFANRWQIKTTDTRTGDELCTTEMPDLSALGLPGMGYRYESCMFYASGDSDVKDRYQTREEAEAGHLRLQRAMDPLLVEHQEG